jgi:hypothetical protein
MDQLVNICSNDRLPRQTNPVISSAPWINIMYTFLNTTKASKVKMHWKAVDRSKSFLECHDISYQSAVDV